MTRIELEQLLSTLDLSNVLMYDRMITTVLKNKKLFSNFQEQYNNAWSTCKELIYWSLHYKEPNFLDQLFCPCGNMVRFDQDGFKYRQYCSGKCANIYTIDKRKQTNLERYGTEWTGSVAEFQEKKKQTCLEKYGCESTLQNKEVREKSKKTCLEKYGVEYTGAAEEVRTKMKQTNLKRYGCENSLESKEIQEKIKKTLLKRYGVEHALQNKEILENLKKKNLEKYGTEWALSAEIVKEKSKKTCLEKYGVEYTGAAEEIQEKIKSTNIERYGDIHPIHNEKIKNKIKKTNLEKYGCDNPMKNAEVRAKWKQHFQEKYGVIHQSQIHVSKETLDILSSKENLQKFIEDSGIKSATVLASELNFCLSGLRKYLHKYDLWHLIDIYTSSYELELQSLFPNTFAKTKAVIYPYEIDLYNEEHKFGIEFNGNYWHSEQHTPDPNYHQKKSLLAEEKGIFLYHIWEYEWLDPRKQEIILSQINNLLGRNERKIYARQCKIREVSLEEARVFLEENHLQGNAVASIKLGLYHESELVSLMTFGKPRFNKKYEYELIRFCNKKNTSVIGGASRLFKYFVERYQPDSILSYSHIDKGSGALYEKLGFSQEGISDVGYIWYYNNNYFLTRYQCQKYKLLEQGFEGNSEKEIMKNRGFRRIFDCGNKIWVWCMRAECSAIDANLKGQKLLSKLQ